MSGSADIAMIGLGVMGRNLARNMADHGRRVAVFDRAPGLAAQMAGEPQIVPTGTPGELLAALKRPRAIMMMVVTMVMLSGEVTIESTKVRSIFSAWIGRRAR